MKLLKDAQWVGLFKNSLVSKGMTFAYISLKVKEGILVVKLKLQEINKIDKM